jgi:hypothetical protein
VSVINKVIAAVTPRLMGEERTEARTCAVAEREDLTR